MHSDQGLKPKNTFKVKTRTRLTFIMIRYNNNISAYSPIYVQFSGPPRSISNPC